MAADEYTKDSEFNIALKNLLHFQELRQEALVCIRQKNYANAAEVCWEMHLEIAGYLRDSTKNDDAATLLGLEIYKDNYIYLKERSFSNKNNYMDTLVRKWLEELITIGYRIGWLAKKVDHNRLALMG